MLGVEVLGVGYRWRRESVRGRDIDTGGVWIWKWLQERYATPSEGVGDV